MLVTDSEIIILITSDSLLINQIVLTKDFDVIRIEEKKLLMVLILDSDSKVYGRPSDELRS